MADIIISSLMSLSLQMQLESWMSNFQTHNKVLISKFPVKLPSGDCQTHHDIIQWLLEVFYHQIGGIWDQSITPLPGRLYHLFWNHKYRYICPHTTTTQEQVPRSLLNLVVLHPGGANQCIPSTLAPYLPECPDQYLLASEDETR